jgi:colanic acid biosynthesis glycosyl transferase WcaI
LPHYPEWRVLSEYQACGFRREQLNGVTVFRAPHAVPKPERVSALARILMESTFSLSSLYWWMRILFRRSRYDAVIGVCPPLQNAVMPGLYALIRRVPFVFHIQDLQVDAAVRLNLLNVGLFGRLLYSIENLLLERCTRVSTITDAMCRRVVEKGVDPARVWLVPNWADISGITPRSKNNEFRRELGVSAGDVLVMYAGAIGHKQGLDLLLDAADLLRGDVRFHFVIVGFGADRARLVARAEQMRLANLRFLPVQTEERLPDMLAAADIHVAVQRRAASDLVMPSKLTNILAVGRPTVATADRGTTLWDVVEGNEAGRCTPPEDSAAATGKECQSLR